MQESMTRREREVWEACDELWSQDIPFKKRTGDIIRDYLAVLGYKKGSFTEIFKYCKTWMKSRNIELQNHSEQTSTVVPLTDPISRVVHPVREEIQAEAQVEISNIREKAQQAMADVTSRYQVLQKTHDDLFSLFGKMKLEQEKLQHEKTCTQYQQDIESLKTIIEEQHHQSIITIDQLKVSCQKLEVEIEKIRAHDKALRGCNQTLQKHLHQLQKEIKEKAAIYDQLQNTYQESLTLICRQDVKVIYFKKIIEQHQQANEEEKKLIDQWKAKVDQLSTENIVLQTELNVLKTLVS
jgi:hypothetical protein